MNTEQSLNSVFCEPTSVIEITGGGIHKNNSLSKISAFAIASITGLSIVCPYENFHIGQMKDYSVTRFELVNNNDISLYSTTNNELEIDENFNFYMKPVYTEEFEISVKSFIVEKFIPKSF
jgi:hypothetical protein